MELKNYQKQVISELEEFLSVLGAIENPASAFSDYWKWRKVARPDSYNDRVPWVRYASLKVPTGGGKTLLAVHSIGKLADRIPAWSPRVVLWFVPWDTILTQTLGAFRDIDHPYRRRLDEMFNGRVSIHDKESVLSGAGFHASSVLEETSVIVLSMQSFRSKNKEWRKAYEENGNLQSFSGKYESGVSIEWAEELSLIKVLHNLNPIVVVDESHRAESDLSREMLINLNPRFVLGLTATPQKDANIISFVDAIALKKEQMVKLPVVAYNLPSRESVIEKAIHLRDNLEKRAIELEWTTGKYIRPIVLFQAESRTKDDAVNYDRIKDKLIQAGIPAEQIAIKVADKDEIKNHNLLSKDCPIRFIITVDALKEWWDCSFAYILASLANRTSVVNVTQILGRVLRQPYARTTPDARLNLSYVLSSSADFHSTIDEIIRGLNTIWFWKEDIAFENLDTPNESITPEMQKMAMEFGQPLPTPVGPHENDSPEDFDIGNINISGGTMDSTVEKMLEHAETQNDNFMNDILSYGNSQISRELREKTNVYPIKSSFSEKVKGLKLPQFFFHGSSQLSIIKDFYPLEKEELSDGFTLKTADANITLEWGDTEMYKIDLSSETGYIESGKISQDAQKLLLDYIDSLASEHQLRAVADIIRKEVGRWDILSDDELTEYIERVLGQAKETTIEYIKKTPYSAASQIRKKLEILVDTHRQLKFDELRNKEKIQLTDSWEFKKEIILPMVSSSIEKSLYEKEWDMNGYERTVIEQIAGLSNVEFWHRNDGRSGFYINGWINHYPDFIVVTKSGKILAIETKWGDRDNSDSKDKLKLGKIWQNLSGGKCKYFMVFQENPIPESHILADVVEIIKDL